jgi:hypothetical protein
MNQKLFSFIRSKAGAILFACKILRSKGQRKYALKWLFTQYNGYLLSAPSPWITFGAIEYIKRNIKEKSRVFEYGSGGSTLFWIKLKQEVVSIEHDTEWYKKLQPYLKGLNNIDFRLVIPCKFVNAQSLDISNPDNYVSASTDWKGYSFKEYVSQIDSYSNDFFDVVLIDGRARPSCIKHSVAKVKIGGMIILDDSERLYYLSEVRSLLSNFECNEFYGYGPCNRWSWKTDIFVRKV